MPKVKPVKFEVGDVVYLKSEDKYAKDRFRMTVKSVTGEYPDIQEVELYMAVQRGDSSNP